MHSGQLHWARNWGLPISSMQEDQNKTHLQTRLPPITNSTTVFAVLTFGWSSAARGDNIGQSRILIVSPASFYNLGSFLDRHLFWSTASNYLKLQLTLGNQSFMTMSNTNDNNLLCCMLLYVYNNDLLVFIIPFT